MSSPSSTGANPQKPPSGAVPSTYGRRVTDRPPRTVLNSPNVSRALSALLIALAAAVASVSGALSARLLK